MGRYLLAGLLLLAAAGITFYGPRLVIWVALLSVAHADEPDEDGAR